MAAPKKLAHVVFRTGRVAAMSDWYCTGNHVALPIDDCSLAEADAFIRSEAFATNPIGVLFDGDTLLTRFRNGEPVAELTRYSA